MSNSRKKKQKKSFDNVDIRKLPKDKRPKPSTGQSAPERLIKYEDLTDNEKAIIAASKGGKKEAARPWRDVEYYSELFDADNPKLVARNTIRRLIPGGWLERGERGKYRLTENGMRRLERL